MTDELRKEFCEYKVLLKAKIEMIIVSFYKILLRKL